MKEDLSILPRERAIKYGLSSLSNADLLAIILRTGSKDMDVFELSNKILKEYQSLSNLVNVTLEDLLKIKGLKEAKALSLLVLFEFSKRVNYQKSIEKIIKSSNDIYELLEPQLRDLEQEKLLLICLDKSRHVKKVVEVFKGGLDQHLVHPRDIFREAIKSNAYCFILCHNHPSGNPTPSNDDIVTTSILKRQGKDLGINIVDHIIIGKGTYFSFLDSKII